jgi:hypothetical protein
VVCGAARAAGIAAVSLWIIYGLVIYGECGSTTAGALPGRVRTHSDPARVIATADMALGANNKAPQGVQALAFSLRTRSHG